MRLLMIAVAVGSLSAAAAQPVIERPTEIRVFTTRAIATVLDKIGPQFEQTSGHKLAITTDIAISMVRRIQAGEPFDFLVASPEQIDSLIKEGRIAAETRTNLARSGIGVGVRAGAPKRDISSVDAFKRTLLNAKSIAYLREGQSGIYLAGMIERLGLSQALEGRVTRPTSDIVSELVAKGEVELGIVVITQILTTPGVELVGGLPPELQSYISFAAGVSTGSRAPRATRDLMTALTKSPAIDVMRSQGMEPWSDVRR